METNIRHSKRPISALVFTVMIIVLACKQKGNPSLGDRQGSTNSIKLFKPQKAEAFCCDFSYQTKNSGGGYGLDRWRGLQRIYYFTQIYSKTKSINVVFIRHS